MLDVHLKKLRKDGLLKSVHHKDAITEDDSTKLLADFPQKSDLVTLTVTVRFYMTCHLCLQATEHQALMNVFDIDKKIDEGGRAYLTLSTSYASKNYQLGLPAIQTLLLLTG